jgi:hypothetical protein
LNGRPKAVPLIRLFTFFIEKTAIEAPRVLLDHETIVVDVPAGAAMNGNSTEQQCPAAIDIPEGPTIEVPLIRLALARSGDKGDSSNIAIIARDPAYVPILRRELTAQHMARHFRLLARGPVHRYEAPGLHAFNFVIENALGGGGMASSRIDPQGKAFGQMALEMMIRAPAALAADVEWA